MPLESDPGSRRTKIASGCGLLVVAAICGALVPSYGFLPGMGAAIFGFSAIAVIVGALTDKSGKGPCPFLRSDADRRSARRGGRSVLGVRRLRDREQGRLFATPPDQSRATRSIRSRSSPTPSLSRASCASRVSPGDLELGRAEMSQDRRRRAWRRADRAQVVDRHPRMRGARAAGLARKRRRCHELRRHAVDPLPPRLARRDPSQLSARGKRNGREDV